MTTLLTESPSGFPEAGDAARALGEAAFQRAVTAYRFWYPTVSFEGVFQGYRDAGLADGTAMAIMAAGPRQTGFTLNSDTPYGAAVLDLRAGPVVIELPPGPYIGLVDDHHQGWVADLGVPGPDKGEGGRHIILPPGHDGEIPGGHHVARCRSLLALLALRPLPADGDMGRALDALRRVSVHPLGRPEARYSVIDVTPLSIDNSCLRWEDGIGFWKALNHVVGTEPPVEEFRPMYGLLSALGVGRGRPFAPGEAMTELLERAARAGRDQLLVSAFASDRADRAAWPDRRWEWASLVHDDPDFLTPDGIDLEARDRWFAQAIVASPAMFRRARGTGSLYWLGHRDADGAHLDGGVNYRLRLPRPVPGGLFWSVTAYDARTRSQVQTDQDRAALRSLVELRDLPATGEAELHFGPTPPTEHADSRWVKTVPGRGWFAYLRLYGPEPAAFDGTWRPGDFERVGHG